MFIPCCVGDVQDNHTCCGLGVPAVTWLTVCVLAVRMWCGARSAGFWSHHSSMYVCWDPGRKHSRALLLIVNAALCLCCWLLFRQCDEGNLRSVDYVSLSIIDRLSHAYQRKSLQKVAWQLSPQALCMFMAQLVTVQVACTGSEAAHTRPNHCRISSQLHHFHTLHLKRPSGKVPMQRSDRVLDTG